MSRSDHVLSNRDHLSALVEVDQLLGHLRQHHRWHCDLGNASSDQAAYRCFTVDILVPRQVRLDGDRLGDLTLLDHIADDFEYLAQNWVIEMLSKEKPGYQLICIVVQQDRANNRALAFNVTNWRVDRLLFEFAKRVHAATLKFSFC